MENPALSQRLETLVRPTSLQASATALLLIDLQYGCADEAYGSCAKLVAASAEGRAIVDYFLQRVRTIVIPAVVRLQDHFRACNAEIIFVRIQSLTVDGRDRSRQHKQVGLHFAPGSREAEVLQAIAPRPDEIVLAKTGTSAFNTTNLPYLLHNLGITTLVMGGVITSGCVELNARDASDLGFEVILVEDACAAWTESIHEAALRRLSVSYGTVCAAAEVIAWLSGN